MTSNHKLGIIIASTIGVSYLVGMFIFGALMHICGPMKGCGDIFFSCRDRSEDDEDFDFE